MVVRNRQGFTDDNDVDDDSVLLVLLLRCNFFSSFLSLSSTSKRKVSGQPNGTDKNIRLHWDFFLLLTSSHCWQNLIHIFVKWEKENVCFDVSFYLNIRDLVVFAFAWAQETLWERNIGVFIFGKIHKKKGAKYVSNAVDVIDFVCMKKRERRRVVRFLIPSI